MTIDIDSDNTTKSTGKNFILPFASSELETAGLRVTRAEFSRIMECSRQAVTDWVKSGRIVVGADGRFDPRQAVRSLLATGDPAKIRARVLVPMVSEIDKLRGRVMKLERDLADACEDSKFHEGASLELLAIINLLSCNLETGWEYVRAMPSERGLAVLKEWIKGAVDRGHGAHDTILDIALRYDEQEKT